MSEENRAGLWVGCYTRDMNGSGKGIVAVGRGPGGDYELLDPVMPIDSPSFLAQHPSQPVLYAVAEGAERVHALRIGEDGMLSALGESGAASALVCHVAVAPGGDFLIASCWGDGAVLAFELEPDGSLGRRHAGAASQDPYGEDRQSRAHSCLMLDGEHIVTTDMGHDLVRFWRFSAERGLEPEGELKLPRGCGPRHFARSSTGRVYLDTEHTVEVAVLVPATASGAPAGAEQSGPALELLGLFPASATGSQPGDAAAEICLGPAERHLYVGVRGSNRICKLALSGDGLPRPDGEFPCGGDWPRHHCIDGGRLTVALERSGALATFALDADGDPSAPPTLVASGSPTCVLPRH